MERGMLIQFQTALNAALEATNAEQCLYLPRSASDWLALGRLFARRRLPRDARYRRTSPPSPHGRRTRAARPQTSLRRAANAVLNLSILWTGQSHFRTTAPIRH